ncbi:MAG TPA: MmpS family transport accessory protein [Mycobacterium sp.]|nr:MmpS family transport accessory protein [Mycobacterium sp.]
MLRTARRFWLPLLVLVAVAIGGIVVYRMHGIFGSRCAGRCGRCSTPWMASTRSVTPSAT